MTLRKAEPWGYDYTASDGSVWRVENSCPPIPVRDYDWCATHDDYDGAPDAYDDRAVYGKTKEAAVAAVEWWIAENGPRSCDECGAYVSGEGCWLCASRERCMSDDRARGLAL